MPRIVLTTLNARYAHAAFGLRYLMANMGALRSDALLMEFDISWKAADVAAALLRQEPEIIGIGVYIWNVALATELVAELKRQRADVTVIIGGPQVSYETDLQAICSIADYVVTGEADLEFARLCQRLIGGERPSEKVIAAAPPEMGKVALPYELYDEQDISHRVIYVEASRGCPFTCEFCLSSLDIPVRNVPLEQFLTSMQSLLDRGVRQFKFVDRTFNLNLAISRAILEFFLNRLTPDLFLHFEMIPDRLPEPLRALIMQFPPGSLQFEVGVQSFNPAVCELISRRQNVERLEDNLRFLRSQTGVHVHADLIVGLPGEDIASFAAGFDKLLGLAPQEIQVGLLKRLPGTPIVRHDGEWGMVYSSLPPFEIQQTKLIDAAAMQRMRRFARYWDLVANSGNFIRSTPAIWGERSAFASFLEFSDWLYARIGVTHGIPLIQLAEMLFEFLTQVRKLDEQATALALWEDYRRAGRSDRPKFLRLWIGEETSSPRRAVARTRARRQARHRGVL